MKRKNAIQLNIDDIVNKETISQLVLDQIKINNLTNAKSLIDQYNLSIYEFKKHISKVKGSHDYIWTINEKDLISIFGEKVFIEAKIVHYAYFRQIDFIIMFTLLCFTLFGVISICINDVFPLFNRPYMVAFTISFTSFISYKVISSQNKKYLSYKNDLKAIENKNQ